MTKEQYIRMTNTVRNVLNRLPGGEHLLKAPSILCGFIYVGMLVWLLLNRDIRLIRAAAVPAVCFVLVTLIRPLINRQRPYDRFRVPPVGKWERGKGKSMPSRHTVSAAAIAIAVTYVFPTIAVFIGMVLLGLLIAALRVLSGQHYPSDVAAAVLFSAVISVIGYGI